MMRSCIYCGRELAKGEVCSCPQGAARRGAKQSADSGNEQKNYSNPYRTETSYKTGYAESGSRAERARAKREARRAARKASARNMDTKGFFRNLWKCIADFMKSPTEKIANPGHIGKGTILTVAALQGAFLWLCTFFVLRGESVGPFKLLASIMSFNGSSGYSLVSYMLLAVLSGAVSGIVLFFLYSGIFYLINRFIMRLKTAYWDFCVRLAGAWIPSTVICAIGALLSMLAPITLLIMLVCAFITVVVLTYEALKTEWISYPPSKVMYAIILGYFVFFGILSHLIFM